MLKEILASGDVKVIKNLYETYNKIEDEEGIIDTAGSLIQIQDSIQIDKVFITNLMDKVYKITSAHRAECREILELEGNLKLSNNNKKLSYIMDYKEKYFSFMQEHLKKIIEYLKKAIKHAHEQNKELEAFFQLTFADYNRYLCEVLTNKEEKDKHTEIADKAYNDYFDMCENMNVCLVSQPYMAGHYHYALLQFEIKDDKEGAIKYLNNQRARFIDLLDTVFKNFTDSYDILNLITDTLTNWIILVNSGKEQEV